MSAIGMMRLASAAHATLFAVALFLQESRRPSPAGARGWGWREWIAVGSLAGLALGAARLGLGLRGVAWLRARSGPVEDRGLEAMRDALCAELGCRRVDVRRLLDSIQEGPWLPRGLPVPPEDIEQAMVFWVSDAAREGPGLLPPPSGLVLRTSKPRDWRAAMGKLVAHSPAEMRHDGRPYYRLNPGAPSSPCAYAPDDRTAVVADEDAIRDLISDRDAPAQRFAWDEAWKRVDQGQLMLAVDARWFRRHIARAERGGPRGVGLRLETFAPLYEKTRSYAASLDISDRSLALDLEAEASSPEDGKAVAETLQAILTLGRNAVTGLRRDALPADADREASGWMLQSAESLLGTGRIEASGAFVRLRAGSAIDLAEGVRRLTPTVARVQAARRRHESVNNLKRIALAFHNYYSANNHFPAAANRDKGPFPHSWRLAILPYLDQQELLNQYRFDEPWDGPHNRALIDRMPEIYSDPGTGGTPASRSRPSYFLLAGPRAIGGAEGGAKLDRILDGTSNTILAVEARRDVPWTMPEDLPFAEKGPVPELGGYTPEGFNAAFADGSVRYILKSTDPALLKGLIAMDGGDVGGGF